MISKKILPLLTSAAVCIMAPPALAIAVFEDPGEISHTVDSPSETEQTMADIYQPSLPDVTFSQGKTYGRVYIQAYPSVPSGTQFLLTDHSGHGIQNGIYFELMDHPGNEHLWVQSLSGMNPTGASAIARVTVVYPDNSSEIISTQITITPPHTSSYEISYRDTRIVEGTSAEIDPYQWNFPAGTTVSFVNSSDISTLREAGWSFSTKDGTTLAIEIPLGANGLHTFPLVVSYPDGTRESSSLTVSAVPIPADSERHQVTYRASDVTGGESVTVSPTETNLPTDILITLADNTGLTANGWTLDVTADGKLTATAPDDADGIIEIALTVTYPDGSTEPATAQITATPAPTDDESEQPITPSRPKAGGSSSGSS